MEEYKKKYLEEESDESGEENNDSDGEGRSEGDMASQVGEGKCSRVEKRKLRTGRSGSVAGRKRTHKATAAVAGGRARTNNKCRVM